MNSGRDFLNSILGIFDTDTDSPEKTTAPFTAWSSSGNPVTIPAGSVIDDIAPELYWPGRYEVPDIPKIELPSPAAVPVPPFPTMPGMPSIPQAPGGTPPRGGQAIAFPKLDPIKLRRAVDIILGRTGKKPGAE